MMNGAKIIAEIGVNHNGSLHLAKKLIDEAKRCGADAVKFQTFFAENFVTKNTFLGKLLIYMKRIHISKILGIIIYH